MKKKWISLLAVFGVLAAGILLIGMASVAYGMNGDPLFYFGSTEAGNMELKNIQELDLSQIDDLNIKYGSENIVFYKADGDKLIIKEYLISDSEDAKAKITHRGSSLEIKQGKRYISFFFFGIFTGNERIEVYVPESYSESVAVSTGSGNISSETPWSWKGCAISTGSGNVTLSHITAEDTAIAASSGNLNIGSMESGTVAVSTSSAGVQIEELTAGQFSVSTSSGSVDMGNVSADHTEVYTSSGKIRAESVRGDRTFTSSSGRISVGGGIGDTRIETASGAVSIWIPEDSGFEIKLKTTSGNIRTDFDDVLSFNKRGSQAEGLWGDQAEYEMKISGASGNINVRLLN